VGAGEQYACAQAWTALSAAHARIAGQLADALARGCALSVNEFEILLRLHHAPAGQLRLGELSGAVPLTQPALSRAVTRLAGRGLVSRAGAPDDGRGVLIMLEPAGRQVLGQATDIHAAVIREALLDRLSAADQELLAGVLSRVTSEQPR
jgi:DNA-binding MarR family transcriptional regulator